MGSVFALDLLGLFVPEVTVWTVWHDEAIAGYARSAFNQFLHLAL